MNKIGIYCITNKITNKKYVGQSINIDKRWKNHLWYGKQSNKKSHTSTKSILHMSMLKYGIDQFKLEILEECSVELLDEREKFWIDTLNTISPNGYNILKGGQKNKKSLIINHCVDCGKDITQKAKRCKSCEHKHRKINDKSFFNIQLVLFIGEQLFNKRKLYTIAKELGYSYIGMKRNLKLYNLPYTRKSIINYYISKNNIQFKEKKTIRKIGQYTLNDELVCIFKNIRDASKKCNIHENLIAKCVHGQLKKSHGYKWKFM